MDRERILQDVNSKHFSLIEWVKRLGLEPDQEEAILFVLHLLQDLAAEQEKIRHEAVEATKTAYLAAREENQRLRTENEHLREEKNGLEIKVQIDALTRLLDRDYFLEQMKNVLRRRRRHELEESWCLLMYMDITKFKIINDTHGHHYGDVALAHTARMLRAYFNRLSDLTARMGGDEFCVLSSNFDRDSCLWMAREGIKKFLRIMSEYNWRVLFPSVPATETVQVDIGVICFNITEGPPRSMEDLLDLADQCMYKAKHHVPGESLPGLEFLETPGGRSCLQILE